MTLFDFPSQHRETKSIWRVFELLPLFAGLAEGHIFRWFAINIPMKIVGNSNYTSDIDIIGCFRKNPPHHNEGFIYKTWEVKVALLHRDGKAKSLKSGKTKSIMNQLKAYKKFGAPVVNLLELYVCEDGFMNEVGFPTQEVLTLMEEKASVLERNGFGYQVLPFEHSKDGNIDVGLRVVRTPFNIMQSHITILSAKISEVNKPFDDLAQKLSEFFESKAALKETKPGFTTITYCKKCKDFCIIKMKDIPICSTCGDYLVTQ